MQQFIKRHRDKIAGVLSGFDRIRFRGTLLRIANLQGMRTFMAYTGVLYKDFNNYATNLTSTIKQSTQQIAEAAGGQVQYLNSSSIRKEDLAREIAQKKGIDEGLVCVLSCVEPCVSYEISKNRQAKRLELHARHRKCLHYYFYSMDRDFGLMHTRLQTWLPFNINICINGREWLAKQMDKKGIDYARQDNTFSWVSDVEGAQQLLDKQPSADWPMLLDKQVERFHPNHVLNFANYPMQYYWSADQTEWASDVMFNSSEDLSHLYPHLTHYAMHAFDSASVMRFLGRRVPVHGKVNGNFTGEVLSDFRRRKEGVRVKHYVNHNSIKMYDKQGNVLRIETTINDARDMKSYRHAEGQDTSEPKKWRRLRKGVADLPRRSQISQAANDRYLDNLASVDDPRPLRELSEGLCKRTRWKGRPVRALNPMGKQDIELLAAICHGEFSINGFRNRDLCALLFKTKARSQAEQRRRAAKVTRLLRLLRAHRLIHKVSHTHRYMLAPKASVFIGALLAARNANIKKLQQLTT